MSARPDHRQIQKWDGKSDVQDLEIHYDKNGDGEIDYRFIRTNQFDDDGNYIGHTDEVDNNNDGIIDEKSVYRYIYDEDGNEIGRQREVDKNNDGKIDVIINYDTSGQEIGREEV